MIARWRAHGETPAEGSFTFRELWVPMAVAVGFAILGTLPHLYGYRLQDADTRFMGFTGRDLNGAQGYLMLARQAQHGHLLFENLASPEPLPRAFFNPEWWLFGSFARWTGLSLVGVFHVGRVATVFAFCLAVYTLVAQCLQSLFWRRLAFIWIVAGSGLSWIPWLLSYGYRLAYPDAAASLPVQWYAGMPFHEMRFSLSLDVAGSSMPAFLMNKPHFIRAGFCAALMYVFLIRGLRTGRWRDFLTSGVFALAHAHVRPYSIPEMGIVYASLPFLISLQTRAWRWDLVWRCGAAGAMVLPAIIYYAWMAATNTLGSPGPDLPPPSLAMQVAWFGIPLVLAVVALLGAIRLNKRSEPAVVLGAWFGSAIIVSLTYPVYRSAMESVFFAYIMGAVLLAIRGPICTAGRWAASRWTHVSAERVSRLLALVLLSLSLPSGPIAYGYMFSMLSDRSSPCFLSTDTITAMRWLENNGDEGDVVLCAFNTGQHIPTQTGLKTVIAHLMLTPDFWAKDGEFTEFLTLPDAIGAKEAFLRRHHVDYVLWGPEERAALAWDPAGAPFLEPVFESGDVRVDRVVLGEVNGDGAPSP